MRKKYHLKKSLFAIIWLLKLSQFAIISLVMRIISPKKLRDFWLKNKESEVSLTEWLKNVKLADWNNFSELRNTYNHADVYKCCVIFDVGGNKYRVIAKIKYEYKIVYIRYVLAHHEYDGKKWQADCQK